MKRNDQTIRAALTKRALAIFVACGLAGGCAPGEKPLDPTTVEILILASPIIVAAVLVHCATEGCGGRKDTVRTAAEKGDAQAQFELGARYESGQEGVADYEVEAAIWYRLSADGGHGEAQLALAAMYEQGRGVERDNLLADMWYTIAIATLASGGAAKAESAAASRDVVERRMPPEQIAEARTRAEEWKPRTQ